MNQKERLQEIFRDIFDDEELIIREDMSANDIEDWDSLAQINLLVAIKKEFKINFDLEEVSKYKNVGDMVNAIEKKLGE